MKKLIYSALLVTVIFLLVLFYVISHTNKGIMVAPEEFAYLNKDPEAKNFYAQVDINKDKNFLEFNQENVANFSSPDGKRMLTFKEVDVNRNLTYDLYLGSQKVGEISALHIYNLSFAPDNNVLLFQTLEVCGGDCGDYKLYKFDFISKKISEISFPKKDEEYYGIDKFDLIAPYVDTYSWVDNKNINLTFFFLDSVIYRVSPVEIWQYDLNTDKYTYIETLPEEGN